MFFFSSRRRHTRLQGDWSSDVCSSDLGRTAIFMKRRRLTEQPGLFGAAPLFEGADLVRVAQSESYVVKTVEQGVFAERIDVEAPRFAAVRGRNGLFLEVDGEPQPRKGGDLMEQPIHLTFGERHG